MTRLLWLVDVLHDAGLVVKPVDGWENRGSALRYDPRVIVDHHTAGPLGRSAPSLKICVDGRPGLSGPLCNLLTGRGGEVYVIASGISNNAGKGAAPQWEASHNRHTIGHEIEHTGDLDTEPLNGEQLEVASRVDAAICRHLGWDAGRCVAHREWAPGRKVDPVWSQDAHRARVARDLGELLEVDMSNTIREQAGISAMFDAYEWYRRDLPKDRQVPDVAAEAYWRDRISAAVKADAGRAGTPELDKVVAILRNGLRDERNKRGSE